MRGIYSSLCFALLVCIAWTWTPVLVFFFSIALYCFFLRSFIPFVVSLVWPWILLIGTKLLRYPQWHCWMLHFPRMMHGGDWCLPRQISYSTLSVCCGNRNDFHLGLNEQSSSSRFDTCLLCCILPLFHLSDKMIVFVYFRPTFSHSTCSTPAAHISRTFTITCHPQRGRT